MDSFSHMDFAIEDELQWEDPFVDPYFEELLHREYPIKRPLLAKEQSIVVFLLAATGCGNTSAIYRVLSKKYGF